MERIDQNSTQLAQALDTGKLIIITTLQKFPWVLSKVGEDSQSTLCLDSGRGAFQPVGQGRGEAAPGVDHFGAASGGERRAAPNRVATTRLLWLRKRTRS